jgi:hypothetical protein
MASPNYKGGGQPTADSGWLAGIGSWFGGGLTPVYKPAPSSLAPSSTSGASAATCADEPEQITVLIPRDLIGSQS